MPLKSTKKQSRVSSSPENGASKPIGLRDLAEYLKLDPSTISFVLNNVPGRSISSGTRERVKAAAQLFNYKPSLLARSLRQRNTHTIGVLLPLVGEEYHAQVLSGVADELERNQYCYLIAQHRHHAEQLREYTDMLISRGADGLIAIDTHLPRELHVPVVAVGGHQKIANVTNVKLNHENAANLTMQHLSILGHRRIAVIKGQPASSDSVVRWEATAKAARAFGLDIPEALAVQLKEDITSPELGYLVVQELLRQTTDFTAIVCFNDIAALGAIRAIGDVGLRTPHDISVVGFDDIRVAVFSMPSITTIRQPLRQMGETAAKVLLERLRTGASTHSEIWVEPELIVRESSGPRATSSPAKAIGGRRLPGDAAG